MYVTFQTLLLQILDKSTRKYDIFSQKMVKYHEQNFYHVVFDGLNLLFIKSKLSNFFWGLLHMIIGYCLIFCHIYDAIFHANFDANSKKLIKQKM